MSRVLACFRNLVRMEDRNMVKMQFIRNPGGERRQGKPRRRWLDSVENSLKYM
jgi:hypothetical protein